MNTAGICPVRSLFAGRYRVGRALGSGGMGAVFEADDELLGRKVALKVLRQGLPRAGRDDLLERFRREDRSAGTLSHPNVVRVFDAGEDEEDGTPFMAMEIVRGGTLKERLNGKGPLAPREAATLALQVAGALGEAHAAGIVHRDVKPENILLEAGPGIRAKVADFGIARAVEATALTNTRFVLGTAAYVSPEQARGEQVGPASDLYSLGVVLYEMLAGRGPFEVGDAGPLALAMKHLNELPEPPSRANPSLGRGARRLDPVVMMLLEKMPGDRYSSAGALVGDLDRFLSGMTTSAAMRATLQRHRAEAAPQHPQRDVRAAVVRSRRRLRRAVVAGAFILGGTLLAGYAAFGQERVPAWAPFDGNLRPAAPTIARVAAPYPTAPGAQEADLSPQAPAAETEPRSGSVVGPPPAKVAASHSPRSQDPPDALEPPVAPAEPATTPAPHTGDAASAGSRALAPPEKVPLDPPPGEEEAASRVEAAGETSAEPALESRSNSSTTVAPPEVAAKRPVAEAQSVSKPNAPEPPEVEVPGVEVPEAGSRDATTGPIVRVPDLVHDQATFCGTERCS